MVTTDQPQTCSALFLPWTLVLSRRVQAGLEHPPTLLCPWARWSRSLPGAWRLGCQDVHYTFLEVERF